MTCNMDFEDFIKDETLTVPVAESSTETLNACGEAVRPVYQQASIKEAGRIAPIPTSDNLYLLSLDVLFG